MHLSFYLPNYLLSYLSTYLPTYLLIYLHTYLNESLYIFFLNPHLKPRGMIWLVHMEQS